MILTTKIKKKLYTYFRDRLNIFKYRRGWLRAPHCPSCGAENKWSVNLAQNRSNCFKCGYNSKPLDVVRELEGLSTTTEVISLLANFEEGFYVEEKVEPYQKKSDVGLPDYYVNIKRGSGRIANIMQQYVINRGFDIDEVSAAGWGYCKKGDYCGYLIMPFFYNNQLIYFNARRVIGDGPKFKNPPVEDFGIGKSMLIYNADALELYDRVFIVESVTNARTIGDNAIAIGGKKISPFQLNILIKSNVRKFVIGLDYDGLDDAINLALNLVHYKKVKVMMFKDDRDINDLGRKKALTLANKSKYMNYNQLLLLKYQYA